LKNDLFDIDTSRIKVSKGRHLLMSMSNPDSILKMFVASRELSSLYGSSMLDEEYPYFLNRVRNGSIVVENVIEMDEDLLIDPYINDLPPNTLRYEDWFAAIMSIYRVRELDSNMRRSIKLYQCHCTKCPTYKPINLRWILGDLHIDTSNNLYGKSTIFKCEVKETKVFALSFFENNKFSKVCNCSLCFLCKTPKFEVIDHLLNRFSITSEDYESMISGRFKLKDLNAKTSFRNVAKFVCTYNMVACDFSLPKIRRSMMKDNKILKQSCKIAEEIRKQISFIEKDFNIEEELAMLRDNDEIFPEVVFNDLEEEIYEDEYFEYERKSKELESARIQREYDMRDIGGKYLDCTASTYDENNRSGKIFLQKSLLTHKERLELDIKQKLIFKESMPKMRGFYHEEEKKRKSQPKCKPDAKRKCAYEEKYIEVFKNSPANVFEPGLGRDERKKRIEDARSQYFLQKVIGRSMDRTATETISEVMDKVESLREKHGNEIVVHERNKVRMISSKRVIERIKTMIMDEIIPMMNAKMRRRFAVRRTNFTVQIINDARQAVLFQDTMQYREFEWHIDEVIQKYKNNYKDIVKKIVEDYKEGVSLPMYEDFLHKMTSKMLKRLKGIHSRNQRAKFAQLDIKKLLNVMIESEIISKRIDLLKNKYEIKGRIRNEIVRLFYDD